MTANMTDGILQLEEEVHPAKKDLKSFIGLRSV